MKKHSLTLLMVGLGVCATTAYGKDLRLWGQLQVAGQPLGNARLIVVGHDTTWTDASGNFAFEIIPAGHHALRVDAKGLDPARFSLPFYHEAFLPLDMVSNFPAGQAMAKGSLTQPAWHPASQARRAGSDPFLATFGTDPNAPHTLSCDGFIASPTQSLSHSWWQAADQSPLRTLNSPQDSPALFQPDGREAGLFDFAQPAYHQRSQSSQTSLVHLHGNSGGAGIALSQGLDLGTWNHLQLSVWTDDFEENELSRSLQRVSLDHTALLAPGWRLWHQLQSTSIDLESPSILPRPLVLSSASSWRLKNFDQDRQELRYRLRVNYDISEESRFAFLASFQQRETTTTADEEDLLIRRLPQSALDESGSGSSLLWVPTQRETEETTLQCAFLLDVQHDRGHLQTGIWLWQADENRRAALLPSQHLPASLQTAGLSSWYGSDQERLIFGTHLSDRYFFGDWISVEARLDLRYHYWKQFRLAQGYFQLAEIPRLNYSEDLLSMEPRLVLRAHLDKGEASLGWRRSRPFPSESSFWDLGQHPENPLAWPLIVDEGTGIEANNQYLLLTPLHDRLTLNWVGENAHGKAAVALFAESRQQGNQAYGDTLSFDEALPQPRRAEGDDQLLVGLDLRWENAESSTLSFWAGLSLRHSRDQGEILLPRGGGDFQALDLDGKALPWIPDWSVTGGLAAPLGTFYKGKASAWIQGNAIASRFVEVGELGSIDERQDLDVGFDVAWSKLQLRFGVKNLLADETPSYAWIQPDLLSEQPWNPEQTTLLTSPAPQRTLMLSLTWRPFVRP
jgi:hypothetical protein